MNTSVVYIYTPQKYPLNFLRLRKFVFDLRMKMRGRSNGPEEVLKSISAHAKIRRTRNLKRIPLSSSVWIPDNEENVLKYADREQLKTRRVLLGPNVRQHNPMLAALFHDLNEKIALVPSESMKNILMSMDGRYEPAQIFVWAAGVDASYWEPSRVDKEKSVLIYCKGKYSQESIDCLIRKLHLRGFQVEILIYGKYKQKIFKDLLNKASFVIWIGHTETQGLAQFQAWSMNVPTLISNLDIQTRNGERGALVSPAPFLTEMTGVITLEREITNTEIDSFIKNLDQFQPRKWIIENGSTFKAFTEFLSVYEIDQNVN